MKLKSIFLFSSALLVCSASFGQSKVSTGSSKYPLLEEGTGTWCGFCPDGAQRIQQTVEPTYPKAICVAFHNGDPMELSGDPFNSTYISSFPGGAIDRKVWTHGSTTSVNVNRGYWATDVGVQNGLSPNFQVDMLSLYDSATRTLTITVTGKTLVAMTGDYRINAYVVEDSIASTTAPYQQHSYMYSSSGSWFMGQSIGSCGSGCWILPDTIYSHMGVVMKVLATGGSVFGDAAFTNPTVGTTQSKTYTYVIPMTSNPKHMRVIGLVQKYAGATTDRAIQNSVRANVKQMVKTVVGITETSAVMDNVELFPNPANNYIHVAGHLNTPTATRVVITNMVGQVVSDNTYAANGTEFAENVSLNNVNSGIYLLTIENNGEKVTRRFTVSK